MGASFCCVDVNNNKKREIKEKKMKEEEFQKQVQKFTMSLVLWDLESRKFNVNVKKIKTKHLPSFETKCELRLEALWMMNLRECPCCHEPEAGHKLGPHGRMEFEKQIKSFLDEYGCEELLPEWDFTGFLYVKKSRVLVMTATQRKTTQDCVLKFILHNNDHTNISQLINEYDALTYLLPSFDYGHLFFSVYL
jgi:hypothetical protein